MIRVFSTNTESPDGHVALFETLDEEQREDHVQEDVEEHVDNHVEEHVEDHVEDHIEDHVEDHVEEDEEEHDEANPPQPLDATIEIGGYDDFGEYDDGLYVQRPFPQAKPHKFASNNIVFQPNPFEDLSSL
jgi:cobalamin biosynthesis protein CobT